MTTPDSHNTVHSKPHQDCVHCRIHEAIEAWRLRNQDPPLNDVGIGLAQCLGELLGSFDDRRERRTATRELLGILNRTMTQTVTSRRAQGQTGITSHIIQ